MAARRNLQYIFEKVQLVKLTTKIKQNKNTLTFRTVIDRPSS